MHEEQPTRKLVAHLALAVWSTGSLKINHSMPAGWADSQTDSLTGSLRDSIKESQANSQADSPSKG